MEENLTFHAGNWVSGQKLCCAHQGTLLQNFRDDNKKQLAIVLNTTAFSAHFAKIPVRD